MSYSFLTAIASQPTAGALAWLLPLVRITGLLLTALAITVAMRRASAGARHLVWLVALTSLLVLPFLAAWAPLAVPVLPATPIPEVAAQVFTIAGQSPFILADFTPVLPDIAEAVVSVEAALIHPARALSDFIGAHALQPVDSVGQFLAVDALLGPAADDLAETITKR